MGQELSPTALFRLRKEAVAWQDLAPEGVLVQLEREEVHVTNPAGAAIIEAMQAGPATIVALTTFVTDRFEVDAAQATADIETFLLAAIDAGVIEEQA